MFTLLHRCCVCVTPLARSFSTSAVLGPSQPALVLNDIIASGSRDTPTHPALLSSIQEKEEEEEGEPPKPPPHHDDVLLQYRVGDDIVMLRSPLTLPLPPFPVQTNSYKPRGMWYSPCTLSANSTPSTSWMEFVRGDMPCFELSHPVHARLKLDKSQVLLITTPEELLAFSDEFGVREGSKVEDLLRMRSNGPKNIDWRKVALAYKGVEISPYQQALRFQRWYYPWDAASGVFWDSSVLVGHEHMQFANPSWVAIEYEKRWA